MAAFNSNSFSELAFSDAAFSFDVLQPSFDAAAFSKTLAFSENAFSFGGVSTGLRPGKVYKGRYPHWVPAGTKPLYYQSPKEEEEAFMLLIALED